MSFFFRVDFSSSTQSILFEEKSENGEFFLSSKMAGLRCHCGKSTEKETRHFYLCWSCLSGKYEEHFLKTGETRTCRNEKKCRAPEKLSKQEKRMLHGLSPNSRWMVRRNGQIHISSLCLFCLRFFQTQPQSSESIIPIELLNSGQPKVITGNLKRKETDSPEFIEIPSVGKFKYSVPVRKTLTSLV